MARPDHITVRDANVYRRWKSRAEPAAEALDHGGLTDDLVPVIIGPGRFREETCWTTPADRGPGGGAVAVGGVGSQNTPIEANPSPEWGDTGDTSETYASSYEPLTKSTPVAALQAASTTASEQLIASYKPLPRVRPESAAGTRYRYVASYTKLQ